MRTATMCLSNVDNDVEQGKLGSKKQGHVQEQQPARDEDEDNEEKARHHLGPSSTSTKPRTATDRRVLIVLVLLIALVGAAASGAFLALGLTGANRDQALRFERQASELVKAFQARWADYEVACLWVHEACRSTADQVGRVVNRIEMCTREDFSELYLYLRQSNLDFTSVAFYTLILGFEREQLEAESQSYYREQDPEYNYQGILGIEDFFELNASQVEKSYLTQVQSRSPQPYYLPAHYVEPLEGNEWMVDFDALSVIRIPEPGIDGDVEWTAYLSERLTVQHTDNSLGYSVYFFHPGLSLPRHASEIQSDAAGMSIFVPDVLRTAAQGQAEKTMAYIFDNDDFRYEEPAFLTGALIDPVDNAVEMTFQPRIALRKLLQQRGEDCIAQVIPVVNRQWTVVVCQVDDVYKPDTVFVILGGVIIFAACICLAIWFYTASRRMIRINEIKATAEQEKTAFFIKNAKKVAAAERQYNVSGFFPAVENSSVVMMLTVCCVLGWFPGIRGARNSKPRGSCVSRSTLYCSHSVDILLLTCLFGSQDIGLQLCGIRRQRTKPSPR